MCERKGGRGGRPACAASFAPLPAWPTSHHQPPSAGKSTLLSVLGGRSTCRISGDMLFNDKKMTKAVKKKLGFVTQDDMLFAEVG